MNTILVADDDSEIRDVIHVYLRNEGYQVLEAADGQEALSTIQTTSIQLVILDVMMPQMDGITACLKIREISNIPIIMLSAKQEDIDKITGLTTGADDYMIKPFNPLELLARVKAQLRRQSLIGKEEFNSLLIIKNLIIDKNKHSVKLNGIEVSLTPLEFAILTLLASRPGQVYSSEQIYESVWKEPYGYSDNTVMVHIRNLREKLEENPREPLYIKTVWGVGYKVD
ncbi:MULTISPECIES: response regulator transcription factor [Paenibacillus]|uniref:DNA-binding response regulator n=1 Tax=Paenibacillus odorifer TaxID=189426 RepID=A0A1R0WNL5_9BACL|nr:MULTISPECIES: response regulator transcription factor [Paenibacillus]ETT50639.1 regulatory protein vanR [Paenibacillus sp. FSL H8-237]MDH6431064.1 DNA-binding response OmpR family regulator [Paenibacillus sp. PastH-4]MDH6447130.1 DNA-binding response OmpR family regulator [Paenibacillus sp. PastF-4]MDH6531278.1 DNA-binding response OmpR family regulator [Paenibacillus sp. PastH-3]OMC68088.1 DNA-binding response regulator [Paenibacillus odorifer]